MSTATPVTKTITTGSMAGVRKTHPAFGMAGFSRISSTGTRLFGSELDAGSFIQLTVKEGEEQWSLARKWFFGGKTILEINLSAAQFAEMLTCMNMGSGVPCTISYRESVGGVPDFVDEDTIQEQIKDSLREDVRSITSLASKLSTDLQSVLDKSKLSKESKALLIDAVSRLQMEINSNMPFVMDQYKEAMDTITAAAKTEVEAFVAHKVTQLGLKSLAQLNETKELA